MLYILYILFLLIYPANGAQDLPETGLQDSKKSTQTLNSNEANAPSDIPTLKVKKITSSHSRSGSGSYSNHSKEKSAAQDSPRKKDSPRSKIPEPGDTDPPKEPLDSTLLTLPQKLSDSQKGNSLKKGHHVRLSETMKGDPLQVPSLDLKSSSKNSNPESSPHTSPRHHHQVNTTSSDNNNEVKTPSEVTSLKLKGLAASTHKRSHLGSHSGDFKEEKKPSPRSSPRRAHISDQNDPPPQEKKSVKILAIDGGGIRGIIPALLLKELESATKKEIIDLFDVFAGTSTGGLIALGLTFPDPSGNGRPKYACQDFVELYEKLSPQIFTKNYSLKGPKYSATGFEKVLTDYFKESFLSNALKPVLVTTYDIQRRKPFALNSKYYKENDNLLWENIDFHTKDAARATSAAPTYFSPAKVLGYTKSTKKQDPSHEYHFIDGGLIANNPALEAVAYARQIFPNASEYIVVSVGTGHKEKSIPYESARKWGRLFWAHPVIEITMGGASQAREQLLDRLSLREVKHFRFTTTLKEASGSLDDISPENIKLLIKEASKLSKNRDGTYTDDFRELLDILSPSTERTEKRKRKYRRR